MGLLRNLGVCQILFFSILNINNKYIHLYYWNNMFFIIYAMNLCNVFHNAKLLFPILIGTQLYFYIWKLIEK